MTGPILAISVSSDFYPGLRKGESPDDYDGNSIEWTFAVPRDASIGAGVCEIRFVRNINEEQALGHPVLGGPRTRRSGKEG